MELGQRAGNEGDRFVDHEGPGKSALTEVVRQLAGHIPQGRPRAPPTPSGSSMMVDSPPHPGLPLGRKNTIIYFSSG
jgi:hypothetical protein